MPMNKVVHAAQRAAFSAAIDVAINAVRGKGTEKLSENAVKLVNLAEPLLKDRYPASALTPPPPATCIARAAGLPSTATA